MTPPIGRAGALELLERAGASAEVISHCETVSRVAVELAEKIKAKGHAVDVGFVESAALLHDIGRGRTHGIRHGVEGAALLKDRPEYARVCERHLGAGIDKKEAGRVGLPPGDYLPTTIEEKIIAYADNLVDEDRVVSPEDSLKGFEQRFGAESSVYLRARALHEEIQSLLG